jgi:hypothetical protein
VSSANAAADHPDNARSIVANRLLVAGWLLQSNACFKAAIAAHFSEQRNQPRPVGGGAHKLTLPLTRRRWQKPKAEPRFRELYAPTNGIPDHRFK